MSLAVVTSMVRLLTRVLLTRCVCKLLVSRANVRGYMAGDVIDLRKNGGDSNEKLDTDTSCFL